MSDPTAQMIQAATGGTFVEYGVLGALVLVIFWLLVQQYLSQKKIGEAIKEAGQLHTATAEKVAGSLKGVSDAMGEMVRHSELQGITTRAALALLMGKTGNYTMKQIEDAVANALIVTRR